MVKPLEACGRSAESAASVIRPPAHAQAFAFVNHRERRNCRYVFKSSKTGHGRPAAFALRRSAENHWRTLDRRRSFLSRFQKCPKRQECFLTRVRLTANRGNRAEQTFTKLNSAKLTRRVLCAQVVGRARRERLTATTVRTDHRKTSGKHRKNR